MEIHGRVFIKWLPLEIRTDGQWRTLIALASYANEDGRAFAGIRLLAARAEVSKSTVARALEYFKKLGILTIAEAPGKRSEYWLHLTHESGTVSVPSRAGQAVPSRAGHVQTNNRPITDQEREKEKTTMRNEVRAGWAKIREQFDQRIRVAANKSVDSEEKSA